MANCSSVRAVIAALFSLTAATAADINGTVLIERKLSRRTVTAAASSYNRGVAVELGSDIDNDPLAFERSHVAVYLEGQLPSQPIRATIEQKNRRFVPDVVVVPVGSSILFPNLDPIFHNVFSLSKSKTFELGNYAKDQVRSVTVSKTGIVFVNCRLHANMQATIVVSPNQWSTRTDTSGRFLLANVPPGTYTLVAWHKAVGFIRKTVEVLENQNSTVQFAMPFDVPEVPKALAER